MVCLSKGRAPSEPTSEFSSCFFFFFYPFDTRPLKHVAASKWTQHPYSPKILFMPLPAQLLYQKDLDVSVSRNSSVCVLSDIPTLFFFFFLSFPGSGRKHLAEALLSPGAGLMAKPASERERRREWEEEGGRAREANIPWKCFLLWDGCLWWRGGGGEGLTHSGGRRTDQREHKSSRCGDRWNICVRSFYAIVYHGGQTPFVSLSLWPPPIFVLTWGYFHCSLLASPAWKEPPLRSLRNSEAGTALSPPSITLLNLKPYGTPSFAQTGEGGRLWTGIFLQEVWMLGVCWTQTELCLFWVSGLNLDRGRVKVGQSLFVCRGGEEKVDGWDKEKKRCRCQCKGAPPACAFWFHRGKKSDVPQLRSESVDDKHQEGPFTANKSAVE